MCPSIRFNALSGAILEFLFCLPQRLEHSSLMRGIACYGRLLKPGLPGIEQRLNQRLSRVAHQRNAR